MSARSTVHSFRTELVGPAVSLVRAGTGPTNPVLGITFEEQCNARPLFPWLRGPSTSWKATASFAGLCLGGVKGTAPLRRAKETALLLARPTP